MSNRLKYTKREMQALQEQRDRIALQLASLAPPEPLVIEKEFNTKIQGAYSAEFLQAAFDCGAVLTGKPDGSEPIEVHFSVAAWRTFDNKVCKAVKNDQDEFNRKWSEQRYRAERAEAEVERLKAIACGRCNGECKDCALVKKEG